MPGAEISSCRLATRTTERVTFGQASPEAVPVPRCNPEPGTLLLHSVLHAVEGRKGIIADVSEGATTL